MHTLLFLGIVVLYVAASLYLAHRVNHVLRVLSIGPAWLPYVVYAAVLLLDSGFFLLRALPAGAVWPARIVYVVSTEWMPVVLYGSALLGLLDAVRWLLEWMGYPTPYRTPFELSAAGLCTLLIVLYGHYVAVDVALVRATVPTGKLPDGKRVTVAIASDLHMGYALGRGRVETLAERVNAEHADLLLLVGDLFDGQTAPVLAEDQARPLEQVNADMGVVAVLGNHDYMAGDSVVARYMRGLRGVRLLRDETLTLPIDSCGKLCVVGRDDLSHLRQYHHARRPLTDLATDSGAFVIALDHQPYDFDQAAEAGADMYVGGHTHGGQMFPVNLLTRALFELDHGLMYKGGLCCLVTSGYGTWGPRFRLLTRSEIWIVTIEGTREAS